MDSGHRQNLSPTKSPDEAERPESPLTGLEFDMARLSLEAQNEGLREKVNELQSELMDGKSHEQYLRREQVVEAKQIREEERKRAQAMVSDVRRKWYKEKQQEVHELREKLHREKEKEITYIIKQKDEEFRKAQLSWNREKDDLVQKLRVQFTNEIREEAQKSHEKQIRKFEVYIEELKDQKKKVEESCKLAQDADKKKVDQIRRMHSEHEQELAKLKRSSWQEGRKQMAEIRQLTNIIHQLEKKLGVESGHYIRLQLEKDSLRDKLDRLKGNEMSGRKSPLSASRTDLSSDLSVFPFPSADDSNPLWLQIKQQKCIIAQLKQSIQDKNRRIDLLKQKLFKNRRFGGVMHRSMDDMLSYESGPERDDCLSPMFGYSTGSSDTSSLNEESFKSDDSQDAEIIRRLQKEILQLQKTHSLLQAQSGSTVDVKRTQLEKEQLQTDLIESQRQIDELNKDLVESHDRNELLEFQLQESLQRNFDEGTWVSAFNIPTLCVEYQFSDEELFCSAEEVKARLEELQNEKKPVLTRNEQLTLRQAERLLSNIPMIKEHGPRTLSLKTTKCNEDHTMSGAAQKDFLQLPMFDDSLHCDGSLEETDYCIATNTDSEEVFLESSKVEPELECDPDQQKLSEGIDSTDNVFKESVLLCDVAVQTDFYESPGELDLSQQKFLDLEIDSRKESVQLYDAEVQTDFHEVPGEFGLSADVLEPDNDLSAEKVNAAVQCSTYSPVTETSSQCNILEIKSFNGDMIIKFDHDDDGCDICKFKKVMDSKDVGIQSVLEEVSFTSNREKHLHEEETSHYFKDSRGYNGVDSAVQCNIIEILTHEEEILEIFNEFKTLRFKKVPASNENAVQTDMQEYDVIDNNVMVDGRISDDVMGNDVVVNDAMIDDVMGDDVMVTDVICNDAIANVPEVQEDGVQEKHDGEPSEKSLLGLGWKDFVDGSELGSDAKLLDCVVYEKEDVFVVICESYRKYCKEISSNDYTFDFDDDNVTDEPLEACSEEQIKHSSNDIDCEDTVPVKLDCNMAGESDYSAGAGKNLETLNLDSSNKNVSKATEQVPASSKTVMERNIEKCEIGIQCKNQEDTTSVGGKCPHCMKPLSVSLGNETNITNNTSENPSFSGGVDSSMLYSQFNEDEDITGIGGNNELDLIEEFRPEGIDFSFREMCDFAVQCDLHDGLNPSSSDVQCLRCGHSKFLSSDIAIQCEFADILSSDLHAGLNPSSNNAPCRCCGHSRTLCSDIAIQCEFADLLSSSDGTHSEIPEIPGVLQEEENESLIKEVMALAKECSKNDALIDQHWSDVVREQGLFSQIQDGEDGDDDVDGDDEDGDQGEISLSDEQSRDLYSEIPNSQVFPENEQTILRDFGANSEEYPNVDVISEDEMPNFPWKEVRDVGTQCGENESLEKEEKATQCSLLDDGQQSGIETIPADEDLAGDKRQDYTFETGEGDITEKQGEPRSGATRILPQGSESETSIIPERSNGGESRVTAESTHSQPTLNIDLNDVFNEMEAQPSNPILPVILTPQESISPTVSDESTNLSREDDDISRSFAEEPTIVRTSKSNTLNALDETLQAFAAEDTGNDICDDDYTDRVSRQIENSAYVSGDRTKSSYHVGSSVSEIKRTTKQSNNEYNFGHGESSATTSSVEGAEMLTFENDGHSCEETSSSDTSSQVTVENTRSHGTHMKPVSPPPFQEDPPDFQANNPPITDTSSFPNPDIPPPLPNTLPPNLPSVSPPSVMHSDLDDEIDILLAGELDQDTVDLTPSEDETPVGVRPTLEHEIQAILESEDSSVRSEPNTILSMDSLYMNQTATVSNTERGADLTVNNSACYENTDVFNDETEMMSSFDGDDVISDDVSCINDNNVVSEANDDVIFETNDRLLYASVEGFTLDANAKSDRKSRLDTDASQKMLRTRSSPVKHVVFESEISEDSMTESSSASEVVHRRQPPPVLPKPKYRSHSMNLPVSELPSVPMQSKRPNSMSAQKDIVEGYFPPVGLVPKRASEFNLGECDLLKERIVYLERQLKNKENLLQSMRAEATEIETNAYIQKKEEDIKMMDESVRFLKVENQKKEKELIVKIGELNKYTFELEQLRSERSNAERQQEILEDNVNSLQNRVGQLQSVQVQYQELRCKCDSLVKENTQLHEQVSRLHRADEEFVELERTISKLQGKLKELEDVKRERDDVSEQLKALKTQKDDLAHKGRKVETERNDFLMNNKLMHQQKENLEARNNALQRTNDTFKTKISSLEKECRDSQRKLFDIQRERDEASSQLRKLEAERSELRKRVNELIECKSDLKQYQSKSQDAERELHFLRTQCKKIESERTELSTELGNCLKERNRLVGRTAELEKLTRDNEKLEEKFHTLKLKIAELTGQRDDAEVQLPTLKAKVALLKKACKEKDDQLDKLKTEIRELKHSIASSAVDELSSIPAFGFGSPEKSVKFREPPDFNNNHATSRDSAKGQRFVVLFDYDPDRLSTTGHPEKELKLIEGDVITVNSELDLNGYYMAELDGRRGLVSSLYIEEIDEYDMRKLRKQRQLNTSKSPAKKPDHHSIPPRPLANMPGLVKRSFVALNDYNPFTSSTSTRPDLELPLTAGEQVTVVGDVDANGYYTVEKGGRLAIVPSNLVKPSSPSLTRPNKLNFASPVQTADQVPSMRSQDGTQGTSTMNTFSNHYPSHSSVVPRQPTVIHAAPPGSTPYASKEVTEQFIRQSSVENVLNTQNVSTAGGSRGSSSRAMNISSALPSAPRNLRVLRCVNKDALLLGWITPEVDELGRNNGQLVKGYKILANGQPKLHVDSPYMAKALVENLDLTRPVELGIQTVSENGFCSEKFITHFNEAVMMETTSVTTEDISYLDNNSLPYRTFVALFSYDPLKSSPNPNPTLELEFQEGDIIRVLDTSRADGYYTGQVNGHEGLVPSNFVEEIAVATRPQHRKRDKEMDDSNASLRSTSSLSPKKAKAMVALYDYNPTTQSPNRQPDHELGFRKGQIVRVLGSMRSDGFYEADINGQRGLVPATFLKPCKRKSTKSVNATNGFASLPRRVQFAHEQDSRPMTAGYV